MEGIDIIIVGGGVIGTSIAWKLAEKGLKVHQIYKTLRPDDASYASMGVLMAPTPISQNPLQVAHRKSLAMYPEFIASLEEASGIKGFFHRSGAIEVIPSEAQYERATREVEFVKENKDTIPNLQALEIISRDDVLKMEPDLEVPEFGALYVAAAAQVEVSPFMNALHKAAEQTGVVKHEALEVIEILYKDGAAVGVKCATGETLFAEKVLIATGAWLSLLDENLGKYTGVKPVRGQAVQVKAAREFKHIVKWQKGYFVPFPDGTVTLASTTEKKAGYDIECTVSGVKDIIDRALSLYPALSSAKIIQTWAGLRPAPSDRRPYMGELPTVKNLYVAGGHYKTGFSMAPVTAAFLTETIVSGAPEELTPFLPRVFSGGVFF